MTLPETFMVFSVVGAVYAIGAVVLGTLRTRGLWKRVLAVTIFAGIGVVVSLTNEHLGRFAYEGALFYRARVVDEYHEELIDHYDSEDDYWVWRLRYQREVIEDFDE